MDHNNGLYRATYHTPHDYIYSTQNAGSSTGAVPRTQQWHGTQTRGDETAKQAPRPYQQQEETTTNNQLVSVTIETQKDLQKDGAKNAKSMTKTYHTLKDMISSRFKGKDNENGDKIEEPGLNNVAEELRKSVRSVDRLTEESEDSRMMKKPAGEQGIYGKPRTEQQTRQEGMTLQQQYNQHVIQQQLLHNQQLQLQSQQLQQYQSTQQFKNQPYAGQIQIVQSRSQEMLAPRPHQTINQDSVYYHGASYGATPQRPANRYGIQQTPDQTYVMMHHPQFGEVKVNARDVINERCVDDRRPIEPRSPQQIERDNNRRKSFEARRAASQPQLTCDDENVISSNDNSNLLNQVLPVRRGSHGNLIESCNARVNNQESEKDSDDGGFIPRQIFKDRKTDKNDNPEEQNSELIYSKDEPKVIESLTGAPRKRLEGEIGKIEGVYNVGQRIRSLNGENIEISDKRGSHRKPNGSGASSDYDKTGGQSSNADSGRGSAAYSSGRRMGNDSTESSDTHQLPSVNYGTTIAPGKSNASGSQRNIFII